MPWPPPRLEIARRVRLDALTTFGIGGEAEWLMAPTRLEQLSEAWEAARLADVPCYWLGGGSNLLIGDQGVPGLVIRLGLGGNALWEQFSIKEADNSVHIIVGAALPLGRLVARCAQNGWTGLEALAGIPGTVGGALAMNAGGASGAHGLAGMAEWVDVWASDGATWRLRRPDWRPAYRDGQLSGQLALRAGFCLARREPREVAERTQAAARRKALCQPLSARSAGCVFRNPPGNSAGRLIDEAGAKGWREGGAAVSALHANFIINDNGATAADVRTLMDRIGESVRATHGITLEREVRLWP